MGDRARHHGAVIGTSRRAVATLAVLVGLSGIAACSAERSAPIVTRPSPPTTTEPQPDDSTPSSDVPSETTTPSETTAPPATIAPEAWAAFDQSLSSALLGRGDYAVGVAVAVQGEIVHAADFGNRVPPPPPPAAPASSVPTDPATTPVPTPPPTPDPALALVEPIEAGDRFRVASISKVITAIVMLQFVEAGQIGLDDPIGDRLGAIVGTPLGDPAMSGITLRQVLSHTAGFESYQSTFFRGHVDSCPAAAQLGLSRSLAAPPGTKYTYSNLNYCLLGLLIENIAGRPYDAVVQDRLLDPLGIEGMRLASTYDTDPMQVVHPSAPSRNYMEVLGAAGSWVATPSDIVKIVASLDLTSPGFHPLSQPMVDLMRTPIPTATPPSAPGRGYGLGMMVFGDGTFGHTGTVENTHAMVVDRPGGMTWSVLVSGEYPWETGDLRGIFEQSLSDAGIPLG